MTYFLSYFKFSATNRDALYRPISGGRGPGCHGDPCRLRLPGLLPEPTSQQEHKTHETSRTGEYSN